MESNSGPSTFRKICVVAPEASELVPRTLFGLGICRRESGASSDAVDYFRAAVTCYQQTTDIAGHIRALDLLGQAMNATGETPGALVAWRSALDLLRSQPAETYGPTTIEIEARIADAVGND